MTALYWLEERDLDRTAEASEAKARGLVFKSLPVADRSVPQSEAATEAALRDIESDLRAGQNVVVHCRQGVGRSSLMPRSF